MHQVSATYTAIKESGDYFIESSVAVGAPGLLINEQAHYITFGGIRIRVSETEEGGGFSGDMLFSAKTTRSVFASGVPGVGSCTCGEINVEMLNPLGTIERMAKVIPCLRLVKNDYSMVSEWIKKGEYYIDTREVTHNDDGLDILSFHAYDPMLKTEQVYPAEQEGWPAEGKTDAEVVATIAAAIGVTVSAESTALMNKAYKVLYPGEYSMREVLGFIGAMYAGNWIINDDGQLHLICLNNLPNGGG